MATYWAGKDAVVVVGSTTLCVTDFNVELSVDVADVTNTCSNGCQQVIPGVSQAKASIKADWDSDAVIFNTPPDLDPGKYAVFKFYPAGLTHAPIQFRAMVVSVTVAQAIRGKVSLEIQITSDECYTLAS